MIRRHRFAFAFLALLAGILFVAPLAKKQVFEIRDHFDYFQPLRWFTASELSQGHLPFWNPYSASGEPWLANPQTGVFYPPSWIFLVLPFEYAYMLFLLLHMVILAWGSYLLFSRWNSPGAAMVGATAVLFSGPVLSLLDVSNNLATLAWMPLVLWCACAGAWRRGGVALALAFLGGEPFFAALAALVYVLIRRRRDVAGTAAIAFGLSAVQLLPFLEMVQGSDRAGGMNAEQILRDSMPLRDWLRFVAPPRLFDAPAGQTFIPVVYAGVVVVLLALVGLLTIRRRRDLWGWIVLLAFAVVISLGPALLVRLPLTLFRYPSRLVPIAVLGLAALAAAGWDRLRIDKRWLDLIVIAVIVADLLPPATGLLGTASWRREVVPYDRAIGADHKFIRVGDDAMQRLAWIGGYLNLYDRRFDTFTGAPLISEEYLRHYLMLQSQPTRAALDAAAIGYVLTAHEMRPPLRQVAQAWSARVYELPSPRAMVVAISRKRVSPLACEITTSHASVRVHEQEPSVVTIAQQDAPGWSVTIDGKPAEKRLFAGVFRAVAVPAGPHEIVWRYRPRTFFAGTIMTLVTLLSLTLPLFVKRDRRAKFFFRPRES